MHTLTFGHIADRKSVEELDDLIHMWSDSGSGEMKLHTALKSYLQSASQVSS